ncbi:MAG: helix-turn-helix domain-containing protein [Cognatishimia sp.]
MTERERAAFAAHEALKMALRLNGTSLAAISRELGVSRTTMSLVGLRKMSVPRVEQALAEAVGKPVGQLFEPIEQEERKK